MARRQALSDQSRYRHRSDPTPVVRGTGPAGAGDRIDPDHHLWRNGRLFWVAFTVHLPGWTKERVRLSLGTADRLEARRRRDQLLSEYPLIRGCELSLRLSCRRPSRTSFRGGSDRQPTVAA